MEEDSSSDTLGAGSSLEVVKLLLKSGADLNARNSWGDTAAHYAARHGTIFVFRWYDILN